MEQIREYEKLSGGELNAVKVVLADAATAMLHGDSCLEGIHAATRTLFVTSGGAGSAANLDSLVKVQLSAEDLQGEVQVAELLLKAGFVKTKSEGRRLIELGGARVNDVKVDNAKASVSLQDFDAEGRLKLSGSKKKHVLILKP